MVSTAGEQSHSQDQYIDGNKRKIESLRIENLMKKAEKVCVLIRCGSRPVSTILHKSVISLNIN